MAVIERQPNYEGEYFYQKKLGEQDKAFRDLLSRYPQDDKEILNALLSAHVKAVNDPSYILSREAMRDLKEKNPAMYAKIAPIYAQFLKERAGLT